MGPARRQVEPRESAVAPLHPDRTQVLVGAVPYGSESQSHAELRKYVDIEIERGGLLRGEEERAARLVLLVLAKTKPDEACEPALVEGAYAYRILPEARFFDFG